MNLIEKSLTIRLEGGLGNQLFQLAAGKSLNPKEIYLDTSLLIGSIRTQYSGDIFNIQNMLNQL